QRARHPSHPGLALRPEHAGFGAGARELSLPPCNQHTHERQCRMTRKKVLLVDDSNTVLMMEKMILNKGPFDVITARDGAEGVAKAKSERPDAILLDVMMPNLDGLSACA